MKRTAAIILNLSRADACLIWGLLTSAGRAAQIGYSDVSEQWGVIIHRL